MILITGASGNVGCELLQQADYMTGATVFVDGGLP
jgi:dTDP-4-dehydrorhamnose reductase